MPSDVAVCRWCLRKIVRSALDPKDWVHERDGALYDGRGNVTWWGAGLKPCEPDMQSTWATPDEG